MVYKSADHGNCGRFCFYNNIYFYEKSKQPALRDMLRHSMV